MDDRLAGPLADSLISILSQVPPPTSDPEGPSSSEAEREDAWLAYRGVPARYRRATLSQVHGPTASDLRGYCEDLSARVQAGRGVLIIGPVGTGKSCALACIAKAAYGVYRELPWDAASCQYVTAGHLYAAIMNPDCRAAVREMSRVPLLLLDELGASYETPFSVAQVDLLFEDRHNEELATCIATNLTQARLQADPRWARIYDRLRETCVGIELAGPSRRASE